MWVNADDPDTPQMEGEIAGNGIDDDGNGFVDDFHGYDFVNNDSDPMDDYGHGTHVSGTIAAVDNKIGVIGVAPGAKIMALKFLDAFGYGYTSDAIPFTPEEIKKIQETVIKHRLAALFALAIGTGAREGELLALGREHLDLEAGTITIRRSLAVVKGGFILKEPKSKRGLRIVELPRFCVDALREHLKRLLADGLVSAKTIFCTKTGHFISKSSFIRQVYQPLLERAKVPYRKFHTFRHTHVSQLLAQGESVVDVARRVGDRPDVIVKTYAHFLPGKAQQLTSRLDALYG